MKKIQRRFTRARVALAIFLGAMSCALFCSPGASAQTASAHGNQVAGNGSFARLVPIGRGRTLYLECRGRGSPTVVLVSGSGVAADNWSYTGQPGSSSDPPRRTTAAVGPELAKNTRVCAYDRPGTEQMNGAASRSTPVRQPTTAQGDVADLEALMSAAGERPPYVVVGHSWGGFIAMMFARRYPQLVSGLVLIDPGSQYLEAVLPRAVWLRWMQDISKNGRAHPGAEQPDYPPSIAALRRTPSLPPMPVLVLTSDKPFDYLGIGDATKYWTPWRKAQALLSTALRGTNITKTNSGHFIEDENARLVIDEIRSVLAKARRRRAS
jgi:pimeloyl-ACP methyl ester carboxylesterase